MDRGDVFQRAVEEAPPAAKPAPTVGLGLAIPVSSPVVPNPVLGGGQVAGIALPVQDLLAVGGATLQVGGKEPDRVAVQLNLNEIVDSGGQGIGPGARRSGNPR